MIFLLCAGTAFAQDYGLTLRSLPVFADGDKPYGNFEYAATAVPWFAAPLGEKGDLYLSGGISAEYSGGEWKPVPELYRFGIAYRPVSGLSFEAGRILYQDPLGLVLNGLFDGFALGLDLGKTRLSAGAFYTGLLYKRAAYITISPADYRDYYDPGVYFASRRLAFALGWEIPALFNTGGELALGVAGQFDLNVLTGADKRTHSQYALAGLTLPFLEHTSAELGAVLGMVEEDGDGPGFCFAVSAGLAWLPPGAVNDRLSLGAAFSSGERAAARAFFPISTTAQGKVLRPGLSGIALAEAEYAVRLRRSVSAEISAAYLFRTDTQTYRDPGLDRASLSPLLGAEAYGSLAWAPVSDVSFTLGGGAFFPRWGRAFAPGTPPRWRVSLETILSF